MNTEGFVNVSNGDDWEGIYLDGKLLAQGHSVSAEDILLALGHKVKYEMTEEGWLEDQGYLPDNIQDVKFE